MAKYPLEAMLKVRGLHEEQAKRHVRDMEEQLRLSKEALSECEKELLRYKEWRPKEVESRYLAIIGTEQSRTQLDSFREGLAELAQGEVERQEKVFEAKKVVAHDEENLAKAREQVILARRACLKLEEHRDIWNEAQRKEEERKSDLEMEESKGVARESDDS